ncbi:hypothetical protein HDE_03938 [Halotydeus destructor]|nr:hypothetical protein HDE_03938 [Halotydeus destructor]
MKLGTDLVIVFSLITVCRTQNETVMADFGLQANVTTGLAEAEAASVSSKSRDQGDLQTSANGQVASHHYDQGDKASKHGQWADQGDKWSKKSTGSNGHHGNWGNRDWANRGHAVHGADKSSQDGGNHDKKWEDWGSKEKIFKDKGHGYVKAFSWDREEGVKDKWGKKGSQSSQRHKADQASEQGKLGHAGHELANWGDMADHGQWADAGLGDMWSGAGGYGMLDNHWANGWYGRR